MVTLQLGPQTKSLHARRTSFDARDVDENGLEVHDAHPRLNINSPVYIDWLAKN